MIRRKKTFIIVIVSVIFTLPVYGQNNSAPVIAWTRHLSGEKYEQIFQWVNIASSGDGMRLAGCKSGSKGGNIFTSTDGGIRWVNRNAAGTRNWFKIASAADGNRLAACAYDSDIYTSADGGATWADQTSAGKRQWGNIASSSDGSRLVASAGIGAPGYLYASEDYGVTWTELTGAGSFVWGSLALSSDGSRIFAGNGAFGYIYRSADFGAAWTRCEAPGEGRWGSLAASADGNLVIACGENRNGKKGIWISRDGGDNWSLQNKAFGSSNVTSVAASADGACLVISSYGGDVFISTDSGETWFDQDALGWKRWGRISISADGLRFFVSEHDTGLYIGVRKREQ